MTNKIYHEGDQLVNRYTIDGYLSEGGMQQVYLARDDVFERPVALKVPKTESAEKRFKRSAAISSKVNHANVAQTLDYVEVDGLGHLIEEFVLGENLGECLANRFHKFDPHLAAHIAHHIVRGVSACHHRGIVHRDLKPSNVMVSADASLSVIKVTDFGVAKLAEGELVAGLEGGENSITGSKTVIGALPYMSPEMIQTPRKAGKETDIWSVGAMLYQLLTGKYPFGSGLAAVRNIVDEPTPELPNTQEYKKYEFKPLIGELLGILQSCLSKDASERPEADELLERIGELCYSGEERQTGTIENYRAHHGAWGFIRMENDESVFFHRSAYYGRQPTVGETVSFAYFPGRPRPRAYPVLPMIQ